MRQIEIDYKYDVKILIGILLDHNISMYSPADIQQLYRDMCYGAWGTVDEQTYSKFIKYVKEEK